MVHSVPASPPLPEVPKVHDLVGVRVPEPDALPRDEAAHAPGPHLGYMGDHCDQGRWLHTTWVVIARCYLVHGGGGEAALEQEL